MFACYVFNFSHSTRCQSCIHGIDLGLVNFLSNISLELEGGCEKIIVDAEGFLSDVDFPRFFETVQFAKTAKLLDLLHDQRLEVSVLLIENGLDILSSLGGPLFKLWHLRHHYRYAVVLKGITIDEALGDIV